MKDKIKEKLFEEIEQMKIDWKVLSREKLGGTTRAWTDIKEAEARLKQHEETTKDILRKIDNMEITKLWLRLKDVKDYIKVKDKKNNPYVELIEKEELQEILK